MSSPFITEAFVVSLFAKLVIALSIFVGFQSHGGTHTPIKSIVAGNDFWCFVGEEKAKCLGYDAPELPPDLEFPLTLQANPHSKTVCATNANGTRCFGRDSATSYLNNFISQIGAPSQFEFRLVGFVTPGGVTACLLKDGNLHCMYASYSYPMRTEQIPFKNVSEFASGQNIGCAIADGQLKCWKRSCSEKNPIPRLTNPRNLTAASHHACAIGDEGVKCWNTGAMGFCPLGKMKIAQVTNPRSLSSGILHSCVLGDEGVQCFAGAHAFEQEIVPEGLRNPTAAYAFGYSSCAMTDDGLVCWGAKFPGRDPLPAYPLD